MGAEYTPIFLLVLAGVVLALGMLGTSWLIGPKKITSVKQMPYESGMDPIGDARQRFDVRYYLVAIAFLLFDVELLFLYPWAVSQWSRDIASPNEVAVVEVAEAQATVGPAPIGIPPEYRWLVLGEIFVFIVVLTAAFAYAWRKGVFTWR